MIIVRAESALSYELRSFESEEVIMVRAESALSYELRSPAEPDGAAAVLHRSTENPAPGRPYDSIVSVFELPIL